MIQKYLAFRRKMLTYHINGNGNLVKIDENNTVTRFGWKGILIGNLYLGVLFGSWWYQGYRAGKQEGHSQGYDEGYADCQMLQPHKV